MTLFQQEQQPTQSLRWYLTPWGMGLIATSAIILLFAGFFGYLVLRSYVLLTSDEGVGSTYSVTKEFTAISAVVAQQERFDRAVVETQDDPSLGPPNAPVTIVEFGDFQCPFCQRSFTVVKDIVEQYGNDVRIIYRDFPVSSLHPEAFQAALAAACADEQGKFWQYHDLLYINQDDLSDVALALYAQQTGLDVAAFSVCIADQRYSQEVIDDYEDGIALGVRGTPTWFVNGIRIEGALPLAIFQQVIDAAKAGQFE